MRIRLAKLTRPLTVDHKVQWHGVLVLESFPDGIVRQLQASILRALPQLAKTSDPAGLAGGASPSPAPGNAYDIVFSAHSQVAWM